MEKLSAKKNKWQMTERAQITLSKHTQKEAPQTRSLFVLPRTILADVSFS